MSHKWSQLVSQLENVEHGQIKWDTTLKLSSCAYIGTYRKQVHILIKLLEAMEMHVKGKKNMLHESKRYILICFYQNNQFWI